MEYFYFNAFIFIFIFGGDGRGGIRGNTNQMTAALYIPFTGSFNRERADQLMYLVQQYRYLDDIFDKIRESHSNLIRMNVRHADFLQHFQQAKQAATENEAILKRRLGHSKYMPPSKGERHWLLNKNHNLLGWIPHLDTYFPCCTNKTHC